MTTDQSNLQIKIRPAVYSDLQKIIDLDAEVSGLEKNEYWEDIE